MQQAVPGGLQLLNNRTEPGTFSLQHSLSTPGSTDTTHHPLCTVGTDRVLCFASFPQKENSEVFLEKPGSQSQRL